MTNSDSRSAIVSATTILLIEDDDGDAILFERSLSKCAGSYRLHVCSDLASAIDWLSKNECDVILLDRSLPDCVGVSGIDQLHTCSADLPIIMLTGFDNEDSALNALEHGAQDYLVKGKANTRELERTIRHAIQRQQIQKENRLLVEQLKIAARSDALTGVLNRHAMMQEFNRHWMDAARTHDPLSCVIMDVDYFKRINDQFGHIVGDEVLRQIANVIKNHAGPNDCVARYGGEEFCVILPHATEQHASEWADSVRQSMASFHFAMGGKQIEVTASFGVGQRNETTQTIERLIDAADQALLISKSQGRNRVTRATELRNNDETPISSPTLVLKHYPPPAAFGQENSTSES